MLKPHIIIVLVFVLLTSCNQEKKGISEINEITVASYYFPGYHVTGKNHLPVSKQHYLDDQSEWELVRAAKPRFEGHQQPKVPAWGYTDEKDPAVMAMKIDVAAEYGIDVFIFDWYNYNGKSFLNKCLDNGFLNAKNTNDIKFALMWANHDWKDLFPVHEENIGQLDVMYPGALSAGDFEKIGDELIEHYFTKPNYWLIDGKAYFSIYDVGTFIEGFGGIDATKTAMEGLNRKAVAAGLKGVHWNLVAWGNPILQDENLPSGIPSLIKSLGFHSATSYVWIHHIDLLDTQNEYNTARDAYFTHWDKVKTEYEVPYFPNVSMGWDSSPRTDPSMDWDHTWGYPYTGILVNNTPENFKSALEFTKKKLLADADGPRVLTINCWNEWTEGSYLEPDNIHGMSYLEAVRETFKSQ